MATERASGIVLFAHGARDPQWAEPFFRLVAKLHARRPRIQVELAFLEHMQPDLDTAIGRLAARGVERVTLVPLFMGRGGHLRRDLPQLVERAGASHPGVLVRATDAIGESDSLLEAIADWVLDEQGRTDGTDLGSPVA